MPHASQQLREDKTLVSQLVETRRQVHLRISRRAQPGENLPGGVCIPENQIWRNQDIRNSFDSPHSWKPVLQLGKKDTIFVHSGCVFSVGSFKMYCFHSDPFSDRPMLVNPDGQIWRHLADIL